ncbi:hypothetical protein X777_05921 [Ooceraea biroi]|uniref:Uncharacterized protein n=1 Tax=Ooceraea biroi TaxID=2015173 RepID=A0A026WDD0_OOCBI|nr:hypothetical protein X777_05921 [Ooceraea biroi]
MIKLIMLNEMLRHVVDMMMRFDSNDGCRVARHHRGRISRNRRLGVNCGRDHCGRQECHRRKIQLSRRRIFGGCRVIVCHRLCHFTRTRRYITKEFPGQVSFLYRAGGSVRQSS